MPTEVKFRKKEFNLSEDSTSGVIVFDTTSKSIYVGGDRFSRPETITQLKKYTSDQTYYGNETFSYFGSNDYINTITDTNNSYTLVEFDSTAVAITGTEIEIPINFPSKNNNSFGNEYIHYFLLKNTSSSNLTITLVPQPMGPEAEICVIGDLTAMTLTANKCIEISTKVMNGNWIISKSMEIPMQNVERPNLNNVIYYTSSNGNVIAPEYSSAFGKNIVSNVYENGVGIITLDDDVTTIGSSAFTNCTGLTSVTIPNSVTSIGSSAFASCTGLTSVTIPSSVTSIDIYAFYNCTGLTSVTIPNSVTSIGSSAFTNVPNINYNGSATGSPWGAKCVNGYIENGIVYTDSTKTTLVSAPSTITGSVVIPNSVTSIDIYAFTNCTGLTSVTIPSSVTNIGSSAFTSCTGLTSVTIPSSVTSIGSNAFYNVSNINYNGSATGSPWGAKCVNGYIENGIVYTDSTKTTLVSVPSTITGSVVIPNSVLNIGNKAFYNCTGLTSVTIPSGVLSIDNSSFYGCTGLTSVTIPSSVTNIGSSAFRGCTGLTSVTIPSSVTNISGSAFRDCTGLTSITCEATTPPTLSNVSAFNNTNDCPIYVPTASVDTYKAANGWSSITSRIYAIS